MQARTVRCDALGLSTSLYPRHALSSHSPDLGIINADRLSFSPSFWFLHSARSGQWSATIASSYILEMPSFRGRKRVFQAKHVRFAAATRRHRQSDQLNKYIVPSASSPLILSRYLDHIIDPQTVEPATVNGLVNEYMASGYISVRVPNQSWSVPNIPQSSRLLRRASEF